MLSQGDTPLLLPDSHLSHCYLKSWAHTTASNQQQGCIAVFVHCGTATFTWVSESPLAPLIHSLDHLITSWSTLGVSPCLATGGRRAVCHELVLCSALTKLMLMDLFTADRGGRKQTQSNLSCAEKQKGKKRKYSLTLNCSDPGMSSLFPQSFQESVRHYICF